MRIPKTVVALLALVAALTAPASAQALPTSFFGVAPQTALSDTDIQYMRAGRIGSVRLAVPWNAVQPTANGAYDWVGLDQAVAVAARGGLTVLPFLYGTPSWITRKPTTLPIDSGRARNAWVAFVRAAVERYGPGGDFWNERAPGVVQYEPAIPRPLPIRTWQVWNEANFFYFAFPVSPIRYARLLKLTYGAIKSADPGARILLSGLFGQPDQQGPRGMDADVFLDKLYVVPGIKAMFDAVSLHPYAVDAAELEEMTEAMRAVLLENRDSSAGLYITEMGWGSQNNFKQVAFEQGPGGQARQLRDSYRYLIANRNRLNLKGTYWFSWKDIQGACSFCDSVGLFHQGLRFKPKPAWHAFVGLTGGRARP
jgi:polysaccharide biosynthesis protein PslG